MELSRDKIKEIINDDWLLMDDCEGNKNCDVVKELARIALASLEAEPVYQVLVDGSWTDYDKQHLEELLEAKPSTLFRVAYPSPRIMNPVSVDADDNFYSWFGREWHEHYQHNQYTTAAKQMLGVMAESAWKAGRRAAMLQDADGNSPVIPDGWVLVPVEPTEDMIVNGFESEPDESFSDEKEWEAYEAMSGCQQAAHRAKLCWAAMIAAAPKPGVR